MMVLLTLLAPVIVLLLMLALQAYEGRWLGPARYSGRLKPRNRRTAPPRDPADVRGSGEGEMDEQREA